MASEGGHQGVPLSPGRQRVEMQTDNFQQLPRLLRQEVAPFYKSALQSAEGMSGSRGRLVGLLRGCTEVLQGPSKHLPGKSGSVFAEH